MKVIHVIIMIRKVVMKVEIFPINFCLNISIAVDTSKYQNK